MKRKFKQRSPRAPHCRAADMLLAVCKMGLDNPDRTIRVPFAIFAEMIEAKRDEWGEVGPSGVLTDKPEDALSLAGKGEGR